MSPVPSAMNAPPADDVPQGAAAEMTRPFGRGQRYMFGLLALVYACHLIDRTVILVMLEPIKHEFGLPLV